MLARCKSNNSSAALDGFQYALTSNTNYLVLGVSIVMESQKTGGVLYQVLNDHGGITHASASLFELEDRRCSAFWVARYDSDGSFLMWPEEFFVKYFHDDLSDGRKDAIESFNVVVKKLKEEAGITT